MELSRENQRTRWLVLLLALGLAAVLAYWHAQIIRDYLGLVGQLGLRGAPEAKTPFQQAYPSFAADAQTWVRHAVSLLEGDSLRLRYTTIDNAPDGREVHWNSAWAWVIAITGWMDHWISRVPLLTAMERITCWLNPTLLLGFILLFSSWTARRAGAAAGLVVAFAMIGHPRMYEGFFPTYVDHHGLLVMAVLGMMLGATFMGAGWWREPGADGAPNLLPVSQEQARRGAVFSALCGAGGMWVSAASVIPPIAIVGLMGLTVVLLQGRDAQRAGERFAPELWRTWGRVGAVASLCFYLVEYFPNHLGLRLESNHPFYSLAWWGGGELIAEVGRRWLGPAAERWAGWPRLLVPLAAIAVAPATILVGGPTVFVVLDPFLARLHHDHIQEFLPLWQSVQGAGWRTFISVAIFESAPLFVGGIVLLRQGRRAPLLVWFGTLVSLVSNGMAWAQARWLLNASGPQVALTLILLAFFVSKWRPLVRWIAVVGVASLLFMPIAVNRVRWGVTEVRERRVAPKDAHGALSRDVAAALRASQPTGEIVLLSSPNSSTAIGYYGRFKTLGTLYWENVEGLKAAASILATHSNEEAAVLIRQHGITHIAIVSEENFIGPYHQLLHPGSKLEDARKSFGYQLMVDRVVPQWLRMLPYSIPDDLKSLNFSVLLFQVAFQQTAADALYHVALAKVAMGNPADAERDFDTLIKGSPNSFQPYLRKGELLFARQEWVASAETTVAGIRRAPPAMRLELWGSAGSNFFRNRQYAIAARLYELALAERYDPSMATFLAFVLATASDDAVRNGPRAVALAEQALKTDPASPTYLNSLAAAYAECGRFAEALATAERALINARNQNLTEFVRITEARIAAYKDKKPWRE